MTKIHPAPYSANILVLLDKELTKYAQDHGSCLKVLDPQAGIGRIHQLTAPNIETVGVEIEWEWASYVPGTIQADATRLPFKDNSFQIGCSSYTYGNRFADHHHARDGSDRDSYTHNLRALTGDKTRQLKAQNTGGYYAWQSQYWTLHYQITSEVFRVVSDVFLLNVSNFYRTVSGKPRDIAYHIIVEENKRSCKYVVDVEQMHLDICTDLGWKLDTEWSVATPRQRKGANPHRFDHETVFRLVKP